MATATRTKSAKLKQAEAVYPVPVKFIYDDGKNHRLPFPDDEKRIQELMGTLKPGPESLIQPIIVYETNKAQHYSLGPGWRRWTAAKRLGHDFIKAIIRPEPDAATRTINRAIENLHRQNLNPIEEMVAVTQALDALSGDIDKAAERLNKPAEWVRDRNYLARLGPKTRQYVITGQLPLGHAREIAKIGDFEEQEELARWHMPGEDGTGGRSLDSLKFHVAQKYRSLKVIPWKIDAKFPANKDIVGACVGCPFNTGTDQNLFEHDGKDKPEPGLCMKADCFEAKQSVCAGAATKIAGQLVKDNTLGEKAAEKKTSKVAPFIKAATVARLAKKQKDLADPKSEAAKKASAKPQGQTWDEKVAEGERKFADACYEWRRDVVDAITKAIAKLPLANFRLSFLSDIELPYNAKPEHVEKIAPAVKLILKGDMFGKDAEKLYKIAAGHFRGHVSIGQNIDTILAAMKMYSEILGIKLPDAPDKEKFMPKNKALAAAGVKPKK